MQRKIAVSKKEADYLVRLIRSDRMTIGFLRGFGKTTDEDKNKRNFCDQLINKFLRTAECRKAEKEG